VLAVVHRLFSPTLEVSMTTVSEIAPDVFRISTFVPDINRAGVVSYQSVADNGADSLISTKPVN
jgi:hypothetical protein